MQTGRVGSYSGRSRLRQGLLCYLLGALTTAALYLALWAIAFVDAYWWRSGVVSKFVELLGQLPVVGGQLVGVSSGQWSLWEASGIALPLSTPWWKAAQAADFFLFSRPDHEVFAPVTRYTGYLEWYCPETGPIAESRAALERWARADVGNGRWSPRWLLNKPELERPFSWTVFLGGNGTGKSQIAREIARSLARRADLGDAADRGWRARVKARRLRLKFWYDRVAPWRKATECAWDTGLLESRGQELETAIQGWSPRAPTFLILDDPGLKDTETVVEVLAARAKEFWFPVRLLVVDQFMPSLQITRQSDGQWVHRTSGQPFEPIIFDFSGFSLSEMRGALSGGYWGADGIRRTTGELVALGVVDTELERLREVIEGSPLLLSLAVRWFDLHRDRRLRHLLSVECLSDEESSLFEGKGSDLKELVAHRLITDRIHELYESFKDREERHRLANGSLRRAIACASIADGMPLDRARATFHLNLDEDDLQAVFPALALRDPHVHREPPAHDVRRIPPLRPWVIAETFFAKVEALVLYGNAAEGDALIRTALEANPDGVLKAVTRRGTLARRCGSVLERVEPPQEPDALLRWYTAFALLALYDRVEARRWLAKATDLLARLSDPELERAQQSLPALLARPAPRPIVAIALHCHISARLLPKSSDPHAHRAAVLAALDALFVRVNGGITPSAVHATGMGRLFVELVSSIVELRSEEDAFKEIHALICRAYWFDVSGMTALGGELHRSLPPRGHVHLAKACAALWEIHGGDCERMAEDIAAQSWSANASVRGVVHVLAWRLAARSRALSEMLDRATHAAQRVDAIAAADPAFTSNADIQGARAWAWKDVAYACGPSPALTEQAAKRVDAIAAAHPAFSGNASIQEARAWAWEYVAHARSDSPEQRALTEQAAQQVDAVAAIDPAFSSNATIQEARAQAWSTVAHARCQSPEQRALTEQTAERVDGVAASDPAFSSNAIIQQARAWAWKSVAFARSKSPEQRGLTEQAAERVDAIAAADPAFSSDADIQGARAWAWQDVAFARSQSPEQRALAEQAAERVDAIAAADPGFSGNARVQEARAWAWKHVASARSKSPELRALVEQAAQRVDAIAVIDPALSSNAIINEARAEAWTHVAYARSVSLEQCALTEQAAERVDAIAASDPAFSGNATIQGARAWAWSHVAYAHSESPAQFALTEKAAQRVDAVAAAPALISNASIQEVRKEAWECVARARRQLQQEPAPVEQAAHEGSQT